jgi:hypothetical protein
MTLPESAGVRKIGAEAPPILRCRRWRTDPAKPGSSGARADLGRMIKEPDEAPYHMPNVGGCIS